MKFVVAIAVFSLICLGNKASAQAIDNEVMQYIKGVIDGCKTKMGTPDEVMEKLMNGEFDKGGADKVAMMCHVNCMMEGFGTLKNGNAEVFEVLKSHIHEEKAKANLELCQLETGEDECETGYKVFMCLKANAEEIFNAEKN